MTSIRDDDFRIDFIIGAETSSKAADPLIWYKARYGAVNEIINMLLLYKNIILYKYVFNILEIDTKRKYVCLAAKRGKNSIYQCIIIRFSYHIVPDIQAISHHTVWVYASQFKVFQQIFVFTYMYDFKLNVCMYFMSWYCNTVYNRTIKVNSTEISYGMRVLFGGISFNINIFTCLTSWSNN